MNGVFANLITFFGLLAALIALYHYIEGILPGLSSPILKKLLFFFIFSGVFWALWDYAGYVPACLKRWRFESKKVGTSLNLNGKSFRISFTKKDDLCAMCLHHLKDDRVVTLPRCGHNFHIPCFLRWHTIRKTCATCLQQL